MQELTNVTIIRVFNGSTSVKHTYPQAAKLHEMDSDYRQQHPSWITAVTPCGRLLYKLGTETVYSAQLKTREDVAEVVITHLYYDCVSIAVPSRYYLSEE